MQCGGGGIILHVITQVELEYGGACSCATTYALHSNALGPNQGRGHLTLFYCVTAIALEYHFLRSEVFEYRLRPKFYYTQCPEQNSA